MQKDGTMVRRNCWSSECMGRDCATCEKKPFARLIRGRYKVEHRRYQRRQERTELRQMVLDFYRNTRVGRPATEGLGI
jgi:hypothetical protein